MRFHRTKAVIVAALAATALTAVPARASAAPTPCRAASLAGIEPGWQKLAVAGVYTAPAGAIGVDLTCVVKVDGAVYGSVRDSTPGPVAVAAGVVTAPWWGTLTVCYELRVHYLTGSTWTTTC